MGRNQVMLILPNQARLTLPKGEKYDGFDGAKFEDWIVGFQQLFRRVVEEEKSVEGQRYRKVVHQRDIKISSLGTETRTKMRAEKIIICILGS